MTATALVGELVRRAPAYTPCPGELADLELLLTGALAPCDGFHTRADLAAIASGGRLANGLPWLVPLTLEVPSALVDGLDPADPCRRVLVLTDPEGAPVAALDAVDVWPAREGHYGVGGRVWPISAGTRGPFRWLRRGPAEVRAALPPGAVLGIVAERPLHRPELAGIAQAAAAIAGHVLIIIPVAGPGPDGYPPEALVRMIVAARDHLPPATLVAVPLRRRGDTTADAALRARVAQAYGATHLLASDDDGGGDVGEAGLSRVVPRRLAYDSRDGRWRPADEITVEDRRLPLAPAQIDDLLDRGVKLPEWHTPPAVARQLALARPPRRIRGVVVFFTGLSGSGKSTVARGVADELAETGERSVTLLDGDVARRLLSKGLGFTRADRDENVRRIGTVAAEAARHGGLVLCAPIAPYAAARAAAREQARMAGAGFVLVYMSTPLDVCEKRDRKGLYARARLGLITGMTGVDDPYEVPTDADLVIDTSALSIEAAVAAVIGHLVGEGWLARDRVPITKG